MRGEMSMAFGKGWVDLVVVEIKIDLVSDQVDLVIANAERFDQMKGLWDRASLWLTKKQARGIGSL
ncbi:hypothetical protein RchiOBHm_Chr5g0036561 [Rosa chinensis]|uniref:Uncharacterized protein n=1 Tax=Rosa chinensis TaxID=74649 RepID=A0A2P6QBH8_ROSCH|nr:hypothetical protein RchiOBHm_Chr5g0036561 [Rosa chinensis]